MPQRKAGGVGNLEQTPAANDERAPEDEAWARKRARATNKRTQVAARLAAGKRIKKPRGADARAAIFDQARDYTPYLGVEAGEARFVVSTGDRGVDRSLFSKHGRPEFAVLARAVAVVESLFGDEAIKGRAYVDVGANIGTEAIAALLWHGFGAALCFEPDEQVHRLLRANLALNGLEERAQTLRVGASDQTRRAQLVLHEGKGGKSWVAVHPGKVQEAHERRAETLARDPTRTLPEMTPVDVELDTLDRLVERGTIDRGRVGMIWIDAEGHEGHVLRGASSLVEDGVPVVFEFSPDALGRRGDVSMVYEVAEGCYTHFVDVRRKEGDQGVPPRPVGELRQVAEGFLDPANDNWFSDLLLLRLDVEQARRANRAFRF